MNDRNSVLWDLLTNEELAEQSDAWRYEASRRRTRGDFGLATFAERMSADAYSALNERQRIAAAAADLGEQLRFTTAEYRRVFEPGA